MAVLVMRTSAMGDVALITPVIRAMKEQYPGVDLVILTRPVFTAFFREETGVSFITPDFKGLHKGIRGIIRLFTEINSTIRVEKVVDLHDVLRTKILRFLFRLKGISVRVIDKQRRKKLQIIKGRNKESLKHTVERYMDVFKDAGFPLRFFTGPSILTDPESDKKASETITDRSLINIGVAPYARHALKMWPEENMILLLRLIEGKYKVRFWLFGGKEEQKRIENFIEKVPSSISLCGKLSLKEEIAVIQKLDLMIAMDSANMHMASLVGIKVISIWGGTDPITGFGAWMQPENYSIRIPADELTCRPCTIYGKGKCKRGDLACMNWLTPEKALEKMEETGVFNLKI